MTATEPRVVTATRAVLAGPSALLRDLLRLQARSYGVDVVADVAQLDHLVAAVQDREPEVVILDATSPLRALGPTLVGIRRAGASVVVISDDTSPDHVIELLSSGVDAVLQSDASPGDVLRAATVIAEGGVVLNPAVAAIVLHQWRALRGDDSPLNGVQRNTLTAREIDVLSAMAEGLATKAIARRLGVALKTVENHKTRIFQKLGARSNAHAISLAIRLGIVQMHQPAPPVD